MGSIKKTICKNPPACREADKCLHDCEGLSTADIRFTAQVNECKKAYTPAIIERISRNEMPECFEVTREAYVAMAQLLMSAMQTIERQLDAALPFINSDGAPFGSGTEREERMIDAGTKYIVEHMRFASIGDRRYTIGLFNTMLRAAARPATTGESDGQDHARGSNTPPSA